MFSLSIPAHLDHPTSPLVDKRRNSFACMLALRRNYLINIAIFTNIPCLALLTIEQRNVVGFKNRVSLVKDGSVPD